MPRFYVTPPWRSLVTNLDSETITFLDRNARDRYLTASSKSPWQAGGTVASDSPEVSIPHDDGFPFLDEGERLLYLFRREAPGEGAPPWIVKFGGPILEVDDRGDTERGVTAYTAWDPWEYLRRRPVIDDDGNLPTKDGLDFAGPGSDLVVALVQRTTEEHGNAFVDYGQTGFYDGTIETTDSLTPWNVRQGQNVGGAWDDIVASGTLDIVLDPVYDPVNRPGICAQLSVYERAGADRHNIIIAWDKPGRNAVGFGRLKAGRERANKIQFYAGQGGPPVGLQTDAASVALYGQYWEQRFLVSQKEPGQAELTATQQLTIVKNGRQTLRMSPAPERADVPLRDYFPGDRIHASASRRLREPVDQLVRVYDIPILIADEGAESVNELVVSTEDA